MWYQEIRSYGFNSIIRKYAKFPSYLPLPCHVEHGWNAHYKPRKNDTDTKKPLMMVFAKRSIKPWKEASKVPVAISGSPFIHYKNMHKITPKANAKGTVAFPSHQTYFVKKKFDIENYCQKLKKLPKKFQPVTVCLFWLDYLEQADFFRKKGFKVTTAGYKIANSLEFVRNYYDILSSHKYTTSDSIDSPTFYAINLGIPFFLIGEKPLLINKNRRDPNCDENFIIDNFAYGIKARKLFSTGPVSTISKAQAEFVDDETGINNCMTPEKMNTLLWSYFRKNHYGLKNLIPFWISSLWALILFNGPWIKFLIDIRKKMTDI